MDRPGPIASCDSIEGGTPSSASGVADNASHDSTSLRIDRHAERHGAARNRQRDITKWRDGSSVELLAPCLRMTC